MFYTCISLPTSLFPSSLVEFLGSAFVGFFLWSWFYIVYFSLSFLVFCILRLCRLTPYTGHGKWKFSSTFIYVYILSLASPILSSGLVPWALSQLFNVARWKPEGLKVTCNVTWMVCTLCRGYKNVSGKWHWLPGLTTFQHVILKYWKFA